MVRLEQLGEYMLPQCDQQKERQGEQYSSYGNPCHSKTNQEIYTLEECEEDYVFVRYRLNKGSMIPF